MKKNIYKIIAVSLLLATTTACEKTFDELASNPNQQDVKYQQRGDRNLCLYHYPSCDGYCRTLANQSW